MKNIGVVLIVIGVIMTAFTGFNLITKKKVVDLGSVEITHNEKTPIYWSPIAGCLIAFSGVIILVASRKKI